MRAPAPTSELVLSQPLSLRPAIHPPIDSSRPAASAGGLRCSGTKLVLEIEVHLGSGAKPIFCVGTRYEPAQTRNGSARVAGDGRGRVEAPAGACWPLAGVSGWQGGVGSDGVRLLDEHQGCLCVGFDFLFFLGWEFYDRVLDSVEGVKIQLRDIKYYNLRLLKIQFISEIQ